MKITGLNLSQEDDLSIFDSQDESNHQIKEKSNFKQKNNKSNSEFHNQYQPGQIPIKKSLIRKQKKQYNALKQKQIQEQKPLQKRVQKKQKYKEQNSSDEYQLLHDEQFLPENHSQQKQRKQSFDDFSSSEQSYSNQKRQKNNRKKLKDNRQINKSSQIKQKQEQYSLIAGQQFKILDNGSTNQFNFKYNLSNNFNLNNLNNINNSVKYFQNKTPTTSINKEVQNFNQSYLYTNSKNPYQGVYQADSDAEYFEQDEKQSPYQYCNTATVNYQKPNESIMQNNSQQNIKIQEQNLESDYHYFNNYQQDQKSSSSLKEFQDNNINKNKNLHTTEGYKKRGRPRKYPLDPNVKIQPKQSKNLKTITQHQEQYSQNLQMPSNIKHQVKYEPGYKRKRSAAPPLSYYQIDLIKLLPIFTQNPEVFDSKIPPDIDFTLDSQKNGMTTDDEEDMKKTTLQFQQVSLSQRKQYQRDMAIVFSTLGFGIAIAKQYFGPSITFTQYNYLLKTIILNSFRKLQYLLFSQKVRIRRLSNSYFILIKSYLTDFKNSLGQQRSDTFKKVIRIAYKFSTTQKYPDRDQLISLYEQIFRLARERITNTDNPVRRKIVQKADFWNDQFQRQACQIYLSCRYQWKNLTLIRSQLLSKHPQLSQSALTQLLLRLKFRQLFRRLIGQVVKRRYKISQQHPDLIQVHQIPKVRKIDDNKIRILIHGVSGQQARIGMLEMHLGDPNNIQLLIEAIVQMNKVRISGAKYDEMTQKDEIEFQEYMPKRGRKRKQLYPEVKRQYCRQAELYSDQMNIDDQNNDRI